MASKKSDTAAQPKTGPNWGALTSAAEEMTFQLEELSLAEIQRLRLAEENQPGANLHIVDARNAVARLVGTISHAFNLEMEQR